MSDKPARQNGKSIAKAAYAAHVAAKRAAWWMQYDPSKRQKLTPMEILKSALEPKERTNDK